MNFLTVKATVEGGALALTHPSFAAPVRVGARNGFAGGELLVGLRPEQLMFESGPCLMRLTADIVENLGGATLIYGQSESGETLALQTTGRRLLKKGEAFSAGFDPAGAYLFTPDGQAL
jgi:multiple sugar transport system ATP-binding protein